MKQFYLKSVELRNYVEKHLCLVHDVVDGNKLLVELRPPIPAHVYGSQDDLDFVVLAHRYEGSSLSPNISEWPCIVNVCVPKLKDGLRSGPWRILDIGEITQT